MIVERPCLKNGLSQVTSEVFVFRYVGGIAGIGLEMAATKSCGGFLLSVGNVEWSSATKTHE
jgi:hypothetical protein